MRSRHKKSENLRFSYRSDLSMTSGTFCRVFTHFIENLKVYSPPQAGARRLHKQFGKAGVGVDHIGDVIKEEF
jgi:hypothetical protein